MESDDKLTGIQRCRGQWVNCGLPHRGLIAAALIVLLSGCVGDHSILDPAGQMAREVAWLWWGMMTFSITVLVVIVILWLSTFRGGRRTKRSGAEERRIARRWIIGGGIVLPALAVAVKLAFGVPIGQRMLPLPLPGGESPEVIEVTGHQWWWEVRYPEADGGEVVTANQLVMPAGEPVDFHVTSDDVIHSFWIPRLGGKIDMVPGRINRIRLQADIPGMFGAQCVEFCGTQHTNMQLHVEALERDEYDAWLAARQAPPKQRAGHDDARDVFTEHCATCHRVAGLSDGQEGPDLSDIGARVNLGAGRLARDEGSIAYWLGHHQTLKPGNRMPSHDHLDTETLEALGTWLETLDP